MRHVKRLPLVLKIALGIMLVPWIVVGLVLVLWGIVSGIGNFVLFWIAVAWLMYLVYLLVVTVLGVGVFRAVGFLISLHGPWAEGVADDRMKVIRHRSRFWICLKIGFGIILGLLGIVVILFGVAM